MVMVARWGGGGGGRRTVWRFNSLQFQIDASFLCLCPLIDDKFRHNILSKLLWFVNPQETLTMYC